MSCWSAVLPAVLPDVLPAVLPDVLHGTAPVCPRLLPNMHAHEMSLSTPPPAAGAHALHFAATWGCIGPGRCESFQTTPAALPPPIAAPCSYMRLHTSLGDLNLELHCDICPRTCENFIALADSGGWMFCRARLPVCLPWQTAVGGCARGGCSAECARPPACPPARLLMQLRAGVLGPPHPCCLPCPVPKPCGCCCCLGCPSLLPALPCA